MPDQQDKVQSQNIFLTGGIKPLCLGENGDGKECADSEKWRRWKQKFEIYFEANDLENVSDAKQIAILLNSIGDEGLEIYNSFNVDRAKETLASILEKFDSKFNACKNVTVERYNFFTRYQKSNETLDEYVTCLNNLSSSCNFDTLKESLVKDMFIIGIKNGQIKERLLQRELPNVNEAVQVAKTMELSYQRSKKLQGTEEKETQIQAISKTSTTPRRHISRPRNRSSSSYRSYNQNRDRSNSFKGSYRPSSKNNNSTCRRCGQQHRIRCPAQGKICTICKKPNHFANCCFFNTQNKNKNDK